MKIQVLGNAGAESPTFHPPGYLLDGKILLDAGTIGAVLSNSEQWQIKHILLTHSHLDHIRGIPLLAENMVTMNISRTVRVAGSRETIGALRDHLMNDIIWPDFTKLPSPEAPVISYKELEPCQTVEVEGYTITPLPVNHPVPACAYLVEKDGKSLLYTGDTGPTDLIWRKATNLSALVIEVSFPNDMETLALASGHLTPKLLSAELGKINSLPPRIFVTHIKPQFLDIISREIKELGFGQIELLERGQTYEL